MCVSGFIPNKYRVERSELTFYFFLNRIKNTSVVNEKSLRTKCPRIEYLWIPANIRIDNIHHQNKMAERVE